MSHLNTPFLDSTKIKAETAAVWKEKVKRWHSLKKKIKFSFSLVNRRGKRKEKKMCRWKALHLHLYQITGRKLNQSQQNTRSRQTEEGCVKKIQGVMGSVKTAVSTGVIKTNSLKLCEEKKTHSHSFNPPPAPPLCLCLPLTSRRRDGSCTWGDWGLTAPAPSWSAALKSSAKSRSVQWTWGTTGKLLPPPGLPVFSRKSLCNCWFWSKLAWFPSQYDANLLKIRPKKKTNMKLGAFPSSVENAGVRLVLVADIGAVGKTLLAKGGSRRVQNKY